MSDPVIIADSNIQFYRYYLPQLASVEYNHCSIIQNSIVDLAPNLADSIYFNEGGDCI